MPCRPSARGVALVRWGDSAEREPSTLTHSLRPTTFLLTTTFHFSKHESVRKESQHGRQRSRHRDRHRDRNCGRRQRSRRHRGRLLQVIIVAVVSVAVCVAVSVPHSPRAAAANSNGGITSAERKCCDGVKERHLRKKGGNLSLEGRSHSHTTASYLSLPPRSIDEPRRPQSWSQRPWRPPPGTTPPPTMVQALRAPQERVPGRQGGPRRGASPPSRSSAPSSPPSPPPPPTSTNGRGEGDSCRRRS